MSGLNRRDVLAAGILVAASAGRATAQGAPPFVVPSCVHALTITAELAPGTAEGDGPYCPRTQIPITGGRFQGRAPDGAPVAGDVLPGGADWQTQRPDGARELEARYLIRTDDGATIQVTNRGLIVPGVDGVYFRSIPSFTAPAGPHDWLNKFVFTATVEAAQGEGGAIPYVTVRVFRIV